MARTPDFNEEKPNTSTLPGDGVVRQRSACDSYVGAQRNANVQRFSSHPVVTRVVENSAIVTAASTARVSAADGTSSSIAGCSLRAIDGSICAQGSSGSCMMVPRIMRTSNSSPIRRRDSRSPVRTAKVIGTVPASMSSPANTAPAHAPVQVYSPPGFGGSAANKSLPGVASSSITSPDSASPGIASTGSGIASPDIVSPGTASPGVSSSFVAPPGAATPNIIDIQVVHNALLNSPVTSNQRRIEATSAQSSLLADASSKPHSYNPPASEQASPQVSPQVLAVLTARSASPRSQRATMPAITTRTVAVLRGTGRDTPRTYSPPPRCRVGTSFTPPRSPGMRPSLVEGVLTAPAPRSVSAERRCHANRVNVCPPGVAVPLVSLQAPRRGPSPHSVGSQARHASPVPVTKLQFIRGGGHELPDARKGPTGSPIEARRASLLAETTNSSTTTSSQETQVLENGMPSETSVEVVENMACEPPATVYQPTTQQTLGAQSSQLTSSSQLCATFSSMSSGSLEEVLKRKESLTQRVLEVERAVYEIENNLLMAGFPDFCEAERSATVIAHPSDAAAGFPLDTSAASGDENTSTNLEEQVFPPWFVKDLQICIGKKQKAVDEAAARASKAEAAVEARMKLKEAEFARREEAMRAREENSARQVDHLTRQLARLQEEMSAMTREQQEQDEANMVQNSECEVAHAERSPSLPSNSQLFGMPYGFQSFHDRHRLGRLGISPSTVRRDLSQVDGQIHRIESIGFQSPSRLVEIGLHSPGHRMENISLHSPNIIARSPEPNIYANSPLMSQSPVTGLRTPPVPGFMNHSLRISSPQPCHPVVWGSPAQLGGAGSASTNRSSTPGWGTPNRSTGPASSPRSPDGGRNMTPCGSARMLPPDNTSRGLQPIKEVQADPKFIKLLQELVNQAPKV